MAIFFYYGCLSRPLASSDAMAYFRPDQEPHDNRYKSVFTISWLVCQRNRSWIKGLGKNQQKEWTRSLFAVPFDQGHRTVTPWTPNRDPMDSEKQLHVSTSASTMAHHVWHVDKAPGRNRNAYLKVLRLSMGKICACTYGLRCELVKNKEIMAQWNKICKYKVKITRI